MTYTRPAITDAQKKYFDEMNQSTVYVTGEDDALIKLFEHRSWQLNMEITEQTGGPISHK